MTVRSHMYPTDRAAAAIPHTREAKAEATRLRKVLENYATSIEKLAFEMDPSNEFTPRFVQLAIGLRQALQARR